MFKKKNRKNRNEALGATEGQKTVIASPPAKDERELIAVLAAAVAAVMGADANGIVIRSYKRVSPSAWKQSGRDFQILNHF